MHYKNGRVAKNGDKVVLMSALGYSNQAVVVGVLYDAVAGNDYCNGRIAPISQLDAFPNLKDCLHLDDVLAALPQSVPDVSYSRGADAQLASENGTGPKSDSISK